jgi:hypothetical protein
MNTDVCIFLKGCPKEEKGGSKGKKEEKGGGLRGAFIAPF